MPRTFFPERSKARATAAPIVDGARDELLAGAGLAEQEHGGIADGDLFHEPQDFAERGAVAAEQAALLVAHQPDGDPDRDPEDERADAGECAIGEEGIGRHPPGLPPPERVADQDRDKQDGLGAHLGQQENHRGDSVTNRDPLQDTDHSKVGEVESQQIIID